MQKRLFNSCVDHDLTTMQLIFNQRPDLFQRTQDHSPLNACILWR